MTLQKLLSVLFIVVAIFCISGCDIPDWYNAGGSFQVVTQQQTRLANGSTGKPYRLSWDPISGVTNEWGGDPNLANSFTGTTNQSGNWFSPSNMQVNTSWYMQGGCLDGTLAQWNNVVTNYMTVYLNCALPLSSFQSSSSRFAVPGYFPSQITLGGSPLTSTYGLPTLKIVDSSGTLVNEITATAVASDGYTATFPFPTKSNGTTLTPDLYELGIFNRNTPDQQECIWVTGQDGTVYPECWTVPGQVVRAGLNFLSVAQLTNTQGRPFGIDVIDSHSWGSNCYEVWDPYVDGWDIQCDDFEYYSQAPIYTLNSNNSVSINGGASLPVGSSPTAIRTYAPVTVTDQVNRTSTTQQSRAIVINSGGSSASILNLLNWSASSISLGPQPSSLVLSTDQTKAYVSCYGNSTVYEINLATNAVARTMTLNFQPMTLGLGPGGTSLWVGGVGNLANVSLSTFSATSTVPISGTINSLAVSTQNNRLLSTNVVTSPTPQTAVVKKLNLSTLVIGDATASSSAEVYTTTSTSLPFSSLLANGTIISNTWNGGLAVSATPQGFVVLDATDGSELGRANTPTPIRGFGFDAGESNLYMTLPDSNQILHVYVPF
jgi:hypothetical protein